MIEALKLCHRESLIDYTFNDAEVYWSFFGVEVASGYFGRTSAICLYDGTCVEGIEADIARNFCSSSRAERNDED